MRMSPSMSLGEEGKEREGGRERRGQGSCSFLWPNLRSHTASLLSLFFFFFLNQSLSHIQGRDQSIWDQKYCGGPFRCLRYSPPISHPHITEAFSPFKVWLSWQFWVGALSLILSPCAICFLHKTCPNFKWILLVYLSSVSLTRSYAPPGQGLGL